MRTLTAAQQLYTPWSSGYPQDSLDGALAWVVVVVA
jgi:hypothetical protein